ncbi:ATPase, T2SS/T4P/T4SS family [Psychrobacillus sp. FSL H8-0484]|uniref:ATPase, T2SS/T4P/T4SS family n=1 Tax=Psychrobacillus sp. FSL H8-0484 TaxID=2921390 RepID=UPI0030F8184D
MTATLLNVLIIISIVGAVVLLLGLRVLKGQKELTPADVKNQLKYQFPELKRMVMDKITTLTTMNLINLGLEKEEYHRQLRRRDELKEALKKCNTGDLSSKIYVRELIYDTITKSCDFNEQNVNWTIPFDTPSLQSGRDVFDILLYVYQKQHGKEALGVMIEEFGLAKPRGNESYRIYESEIRHIYKKKVKALRQEDKVRIIANRIYSQYKGFGVIDDIRDMNIDGVSGGVSGVPNKMQNFDDEELLYGNMQNGSRGLNSVWVMYKGKSIHLEFLEFEHEAELRRVIENIYKFNYPGQLSESRPYMINEMADGSRVTVVRPKFAESWAFFVRKKYDSKQLELEELITHQNGALAIELMQYLMKGNRVTAITGSQGSGKTTILMALVRYIHPSHNLRIQETSFELNLRKIYPKRNILSFQETDIISGQEGLDLQKKTDGDVNILGEVATDPVAAWMIQTTQVASLFTIFTHHAKTFTDLVYALRNSLLKVNIFNNESIAEQQVVSVLEFDIHLRQDKDGSRYIERITECIPLHTVVDNHLEPLPINATTDDKMNQFFKIATTYFHQQTSRKQFTERNIIEFRNGEYIAVHPISTKRQEEIKQQLSEDEEQAFSSFLDRVWGSVA